MSARGSAAGGTRGCGLRLGGVGLVLVLIAGLANASDEAPSLRRALVPADRPDIWPSGEWEPVPRKRLDEFLRSQEQKSGRSVPPPLIERIVYRGSLVALERLTGNFEATVQRPSEESRFLVLGAFTPAFSALSWSDGPAVAGTAPDGEPLLFVDRVSGELSGEWSLAAEEIHGQYEFDWRSFPAASTRLELLLPAEYELRASGGVLLAPETAEEGRRLWTIELGQRPRCTLSLWKPDAATRGTTLQVERSTLYSMRVGGCRLQADFQIFALHEAPRELLFAVPPELENPQVSLAGSLSVSARMERSGSASRLIVPLPPLPAGRLGTVRVSGDLMLREDVDWTLPDVRLENSVPLSGVRRLHVDRPLKLHSVHFEGLRQSGISIAEGAGDWLFEEVFHDPKLVVRVGQPEIALTAQIVTSVERDDDEVRFRSLARIQSRGGKTFRVGLRLPRGWGVIDVTASSGNSSALASWQLTESASESLLELEFRHAITDQSPHQVLITGKRVRAEISEPISLFPHLESAADSRLLFAVRDSRLAPNSPVAVSGAERFQTGQLPEEWRARVDALGLNPDDPEISWWVQNAAPDGALSVLARTTDRDPSPPDSEAPDAAAVPNHPRTPCTLDLVLTSEIAPRGSEWHLHRAEYLLSGAVPARIEFRLPPGTQVDAAAIDGQLHRALANRELMTLPELPAGTKRIELRYRTPARAPGGWLQRRVEVPVLFSSETLEQLEWRIHLPRTERLVDVSLPLAAIHPRQTIDWTQRLFGPLARDGAAERFRPFSASFWRALWQGGERSTGVRAVTIVSLDPPDLLKIELADTRNVMLAGWLSLLGAVLIVCLIRLQWPHIHALGWGPVAGLILGATLSSAVWASLCGGALVGTLIAFLLPRSWIARRDLLQPLSRRETGASQSRAAAAAGGLLLCAVLWTDLRAQPANDAAQPMPDDSPAAGDFDVLIPQGDPSKNETGWLKRSLLPVFEAWMQMRNLQPPYMVQTARYELTPDSDLRAELEVVVFDTSATVPVIMPFGGLTVRDPGDCRIDGEPAQLRPAAKGPALVVAVPGATALAPESPPYRRVRIELHLRPGAQARIEDGWAVDVVPALNATLRLPGTPESGEPWSIFSQAAPRPEETGQVFELGTRSSLVMKRGTEAPRPMELIKTAEAVSLVEVHPMRLRVRTQLIPQELLERPAAAHSVLRLVLPGMADVREVAAPTLRSYWVRYPDPETTLLELDLEQALTPRRAIHLDFTVPARTSGDKVEIPPIALLDGECLKNHRIGVRAAPGLMIGRDLPQSAGQLREIPPEMFHAGLNAEFSWPAPERVFVTARPTELDIPIVGIQPVRSAALEQTIVIQDELVRWQASAAIDLSVAPAYQHELTLDPAVRLDTVTVVQDGADRLLDWSRHGERMVLYLDGERIGRQTVQLSGFIPLRKSEAAPFPRLALLDATITASELIVQNNSSYKVELLQPDGSVLSPAAPPQQPASDAPAVRRFNLQSAALPAACRIVAASRPPAVDAVLDLLKQGESWRLRARFRARGSQSLDQPIRLTLPSEFAASAETQPHFTLTCDAESDGRVTCELRRTAAAPVTEFSISFPISVPEQADWSVPEFEFTGITVESEALVIPPDFPLAPESSEAAVDVALLTEEQQQLISEEPTDPGCRFYLLVEGDRRLRPYPRKLQRPEVRLAETVLWRTPEAGAAGLSTFWIVAQHAHCELRIPWRSNVELQRADWNGSAPETLFGPEGHLIVRTANLAPGGLYRLELEWTAPANASLSSTEPWRPLPIGSDSMREFLAVVPRKGFYEWPREAESSRAEFNLARITALLDLLETGSRERIRNGAVEALAGHIEALFGALESVPHTPQPSLRAVRERWNRLRESLLPQRNGPAGVQDESLSSPQVMNVAVSDPRAVLMIEEHGSPIRLWSLHGGLTLMALCIAVVMALVVVAWFAREVPERFAMTWMGSAPLGLLVLGVIWCAWLKYGWVGLVLIGVAVVLQVQAWRRLWRQPAQVLERGSHA